MRRPQTSSTTSTPVSKKMWIEESFPEDKDGGNLSPDGRVIEMLSEHTLEGMLEGYLLTGRHGFFSCYEAFVHIIDSMFNQYAKWLEICNHLSWRDSIASLNLLITSTVWRQDHNGFTHQDPGFLDVVVNKSANVTSHLSSTGRELSSLRCRPLPP
jgi:xylulose-5-phosphate/fructose-6-phosphate phosphoketolase